MTQTGVSRARTRLVATLLAPVLMIVALVSWSLASPAGASPDDDFHLTSIWCGDGIRAGLCQTGNNANERVVPKALGESYCFTFRPATSAACQTAAVSSNSTVLAASARGNWTGDYPPVFYSVLGLFAGSNVAVSIVFMRVFNALLFVGLSTWLYALLPRNRRAALVWGFAVTLVPLGIFLIPSTNPSSWAVISAGTLWIALLGYFESFGRRKLGLGAVAAISTILGAAARADAAVYAIVAIFAVAVISVKRDRKSLLSLLLPVGLVVIAVLFFLAAKQASFGTSGLPSRGAANTGPGWQYLLFKNILNVPALWANAFGSAPLGWLDTDLPAIVWVLGFAVFAGVTFTGLRSLPLRKAIALVGVGAALWLIPTYVLVKSNAVVGEQVQARYVLPLLIVLAGIALVQAGGRELHLMRGQATILVGALTVANSVALHTNIRRYVTGVDVTSWNLNAGAEWWWAIPASPMAIWAIGTVSFAAALTALSPAIWSPRAVIPDLTPSRP